MQNQSIPFGIICNSHTDFKRKRNGMIDFVKKAFRNFIEVILWINLLLAVIIGGVAGYYIGQLISYRNAGGYVFIGIIIGLICGLLTNIIGGGFITTILSIDENLKQLKQKITGNTENIEENDSSSKINKMLSDYNFSSDNNKNNKIIIKRIKSNFGGAVAVEINVDNQPGIQLSKEEEKTVNVGNGRHIIIARYYDDICKMEFELNNNSKNFNVFVNPKLKIEMI